MDKTKASLKKVSEIMATLRSLNSKRESRDKAISLSERFTKSEKKSAELKSDGGDVSEVLESKMKKQYADMGNAIKPEEIEKLLSYESNYVRSTLPLIDDNHLSPETKSLILESLDNETHLNVDEIEAAVVDRLGNNGREYHKYEAKIDEDEPQKEIILSFTRFSDALQKTLEDLEATIEALEKHLEAVEKVLGENKVAKAEQEKAEQEKASPMQSEEKVENEEIEEEAKAEQEELEQSSLYGDALGGGEIECSMKP